MSDSDLSDLSETTQKPQKTKAVKRLHHKQKFVQNWMKNSQFKSWLRPAQSVYKGRCAVCNVQFVADLSTIKKHLISKTHVGNTTNVGFSTPKISKYFKSSTDDTDTATKIAEIKLCALLAEHNISFSLMDHLCPLLKCIFKDSNVAKNLSLKRTKANAIVTNVIGKTHKTDLQKQLTKYKFSCLVDESTDIASSKTICIVVRFFNEEKLKLTTVLWDLLPVFSPDQECNFEATGEHIFNIIIKSFEDCGVPTENICGFGSDGCNVMMGEFNSVASRFRKKCPGIYIVKCICHSLHICASNACKELPRSCEDLARNVYAFFKVSKIIKLTCRYLAML